MGLNFANYVDCHADGQQINATVFDTMD